MRVNSAAARIQRLAQHHKLRQSLIEGTQAIMHPGPESPMVDGLFFDFRRSSERCIQFPARVDPLCDTCNGLLRKLIAHVRHMRFLEMRNHLVQETGFRITRYGSKPADLPERSPPSPASAAAGRSSGHVPEQGRRIGGAPVPAPAALGAGETQNVPGTSSGLQPPERPAQPFGLQRRRQHRRASRSSSGARALSLLAPTKATALARI